MTPKRTLNRKEVEASLLKKGFEQEPGGHHIFFRYFSLSGDDLGIRTKMSHGKKKQDIDSSLASYMARQCQLTLSDFKDLINCSLSQQGYELILKEKGLIGNE